MNPNEVPAEMVEKAYRARADYMRGEPIGDLEWQAVWSTIEADGMRHALAAVMPDIQAQAFEAAAVRVRANFAAHGEQCPWVGFLDDEAARLRAARLTTTTEGDGDDVSDEMTRLDEIAARLEAEPDGPDLCPVGECEVCTQVRDARAMLAVVRGVAGLHKPRLVTCLNPMHDPCPDARSCGTCDVAWPCPTARAVQALTETEENR